MFDFESVKKSFFDRDVVIDAVGRAARQLSSRAGSFVRRRAKSSIRKRLSVSKPGKPPTNRVGLLRNFIYFAWDRQRHSTFVGPVLLRRSTGAPERLEYGGKVQGDGREITLTNDPGRDSRTGRFVSNGKRTVKLEGVLTYRPRPYMRPALDAERPRIAEQFRNSVRR